MPAARVHCGEQLLLLLVTDCISSSPWVLVGPTCIEAVWFPLATVIGIHA